MKDKIIATKTLTQPLELEAECIYKHTFGEPINSHAGTVITIGYTITTDNNGKVIFREDYATIQDSLF